jgi:serine/threonine protein kinase/WD40 repeat protein
MNERDIFSAALDIEDAAERAAYLARACADDHALRQRVAALISAHKPASSFLERPVGGLVATLDEPPITEKPGTVIGPYKLLQKIGEGGMGVVYMAEQAQPVRRRVALKIIKPGMDSAQVVARFEAERQALALMDHQNIARVYDAGATDTGRPYFVMELVHGVPITRFCDDNKLTPRERLGLFVPVCQAVQHAHQKGVIHRDLKPTNVLVCLYDGKPVPKIIDFGVAKATSQPLTERTMFTQFGTLVGTLEYMSPEQAEMSQLGIDTRSDVYSLGVLLYELLTGATPLERKRLREVAFDELLRIIREEEPLKPSTRLSSSGAALAGISAQRKTEPGRLTRLVRGELDWIVMKALEKDRTRRYDSASGLARDLERYLTDEAVEACPPTLGYRARKFARKNRKPLTAAAAFGLLLLGGIAASSWQAIRATRAEEHAFLERDEAEKAREAEADQRGIAVAERNTAQQERDAANAARAELRRAHYAVTMNLIPTAWEADNYGRVLELLDDLRPKAPDETDLRGFEWHHWDNLSHAERRTQQPQGPGRVLSLSLSGDGSRMAGHVAVNNGEAKTASFVKVWDTAGGRELRSWPVDANANQQLILVLNHDGSRLVGRHAVREGTRWTNPWVQAWEVATGKVIFTRKELFFRDLAISADGKRLATVDGEDMPMPRAPHVVKVWDLAAPDREPTIMEGSGSRLPHDLSLSPDGSRLVCIYAGTGPTPAHIPLWDTATGKARAKIEGERPFVDLRGLAFSPDGARLAAVGRERIGSANTIDQRYHCYLWERTASDEFKLLHNTPTAAAGGVVRLAFSPDGRTLAAWTTGMLGGTAVRLLDAASGVERQVVRGHAAQVESAAFSADGTRLITAGDTNVSQPGGPLVKEWDVAPATTLGLPATVTVQSPTGDRLAVYQRSWGSPQKPEGGSAEVTIRDRAGKEIVVFRGHDRVHQVTFSPDGRLVVSREWGGQTKIWETDTGNVRWASGKLPAAQLSPAAWSQPFSADGRLLALPEPDGVKVVRAADFQPLFGIGDTFQRYFSPDGRRLVAWYRNPVNPDQPRPPGKPQGVMKLWDVDAGREIMSTPPADFPDSVVFSPDSRFFACGSLRADRDLTVWEATTGAQQITLKDAFARHLAFNPDGTRLVTAYSRESGMSGATVWDLGTGKVLHRLRGHSGLAGPVNFSPDGKRIVSASLGLQTDELTLWDAVTGRELLSLKAKHAPSYDLEFSPDGHRLIRSSGRGGPGALLLNQVWDATPRAEK